MEIRFPFFLNLDVEYFVYIIFSSSGNRYYVGFSEDPEVRLIKHNFGATTSIRSGRAWVLVYTERLSDNTCAMKREKQIKSMRIRLYIENLIKKMLQPPYSIITPGNSRSRKLFLCLH